jgi:hypothetical protein
MHARSERNFAAAGITVAVITISRPSGSNLSSQPAKPTQFAARRCIIGRSACATSFHSS